MNNPTSSYIVVFIGLGFLFVTIGILAETWIPRLSFCGLGMLTLLAGVVIGARGKSG